MIEVIKIIVYVPMCSSHVRVPQQHLGSSFPLFRMVINPLFRVPCILVAMVGLNTTVTPPHPPPDLEEVVPSINLESVLKQRFAPLMVKVCSHYLWFIPSIDFPRNTRLFHGVSHSLKSPSSSHPIFRNTKCQK